MNPHEIFDNAKNLAKEKGKCFDNSRYIGLSSVGGDYSIHKDNYVFNKKGLIIKYSFTQFEDGYGKKESLDIYIKNGLFSPKLKVYSFFIKVGEKDKVWFPRNGEWEGKLENLAKNIN